MIASDAHAPALTIAVSPSGRPRVVPAEGESDGEVLTGDRASAVRDAFERSAFPAPGQIGMRCSCPDWVAMCKHVAAVLYGVGSRLDTKPELLFVLRGVDHLELIDGAASARVLPAQGDRDPAPLGGRAVRRLRHRDRRRPEEAFAKALAMPPILRRLLGCICAYFAQSAPSSSSTASNGSARTCASSRQVPSRIHCSPSSR